MNDNRIDSTPVRMSTNVSVDRQTPKRDFGDRVQLGLSQTGTAVANGVSVIAPAGAQPILSAAVSAMSVNGRGSSTGMLGGGQMGMGAYGSGVTSLGGGSINTTVGGSSGVPTVSATPLSSSLPSSTNGSTNSVLSEVSASGNSAVDALGETQKELLSMQISMQQENQVFTTISNVLKTKHDTAKNSIQNIH